MTVVQLLPYYKDKHLITWGRATEATITGKENPKGKDGGAVKDVISVTYQFVDADGKAVKGGTLLYPSYWPTSDHLDNPTVVYDPRDSAKNLLYPSYWVMCYPPR
jgi:hypothetical protein